MLENALLDLAPDEALEMNRKRKMLRWDAKKRKFVKVLKLITPYLFHLDIDKVFRFKFFYSLSFQQTLEEFSQKKGASRSLRSESGGLIQKSSKPQVFCNLNFAFDINLKVSS